MSRRSIIKRAKIERTRRLEFKNWGYIQHSAILALGKSIVESFTQDQMTQIAKAVKIPAHMLRGDRLTYNQREEYLKLLHGV